MKHSEKTEHISGNSSVLQKLLKVVSGITGTPKGAYNIRQDGKSIGRQSTDNIEIRSKENGQGIEIYVKPGTKGEFVHIPVVVDESGFADVVYNDFFIGDDADVDIVAGCGIHNDGIHLSQHDGVHTFHVGKNAKVRYVEKHYGEGDGEGKRILNPTTIIHIEEDGYFEMDSVQIKGVDSTIRDTEADLAKGASIVIHEKIMTHGSQVAKTNFKVDMNGEGSSANVVSRSVAKGNSKQVFASMINGNNACNGHTECDAIIMDHSSVTAVPQLTANNIDAALIHEAAIGKIAGDQLNKLMTLGLTEEEAEEQIVNGFLK